MLEKENPAKLKADEYAEFLAKFEAKKTTDDCYTPPAVYQAVVDYIDEHIIDLSDKNIVRPFYPNGDYQADAVEYDENTIVIDNPPFSISAEIQQFYQRNSVKFFLFCPALTAFSTYPKTGASYVVTEANIKYANGAVVATAFATNLLGGTAIKGCPILAEQLSLAQQDDKPKLPKYNYPDNVVMVSAIKGIVGKGESIEIARNEIVFTRQLDAQKAYKKTLFGSGFLVGDNVAERIKAERIKVSVDAIEWELSERERRLIENRNNTLIWVKENERN